MKIYRFDVAAGKPVHLFGSDFIHAHILHTPGAATVPCTHLGPQSLIGYCQATVPQLFLGVQGEG